MAAALRGRGGLCVVSAPNSGKSALLGRAIAALPDMGVAVVRLGADAAPRDIEAALRPHQGEPGGRRLILIEQAHRLSIPALQALNGCTARSGLAAGLLLAGTPDLLHRLTAAHADRLLSYPAFTLDPTSAVAVPAMRPATPRQPGGATEHLPQALLATVAVVIAGSAAVFVVAPHGIDRWPPVGAGPNASAAPLNPTLPLSEVVVEPPEHTIEPAPTDLPRSSAPERNADLPGAMLGGPGLLLVAREGDTLQRLYRSVYDGFRPPSFRDVENANPHPIRAGVVVVFPTPPDGWRKP